MKTYNHPSRWTHSRVVVDRGMLLTLALALFICITSLPARAQLVLDFTGGNANTFSGSATVGWEFTLTTTLVVTGLGFWDEGGNGLLNNHDIGLWNSNDPSQLLASTTISNGNSVPVVSTSSDGRWLFTSIVPITLQPGTYVVGATIVAFDQDLQRFGTTASTISGLTFVQGRNISSSSLAYPLASGTANDGIFGPNLQGTVVPEPSTVAQVGLGLTVLVVLRGLIGRRRGAI